MSVITEKNSPKGFYFDGVWNPIIWIEGLPYRNRIECLILQGDKVYLSIDERSKKEELIEFLAVVRIKIY